jgi:pyruvate kinase
MVESNERGVLSVRITHAKIGGSGIRSDKGINLPDSHLRISGLTDKDRRDLQFIARYADAVALSFVSSAADVRLLREELKRIGCRGIGIVLKIEIAQALRHLRPILLAAMSSYPIGVMIARGDLAIEIGFDRLAQAQQEIIWHCEAAHIPVIWATQVLENLAKEGHPSRAEITDAAMGVDAECVMLNKGPFILKTILMLDGILRRTELQERKTGGLVEEREEGGPEVIPVQEGAP